MTMAVPLPSLCLGDRNVVAEGADGATPETGETVAETPATATAESHEGDQDLINREPSMGVLRISRNEQGNVTRM